VCAAAVTLTNPGGLGANFGCMAYATTGQVTFAVSGTGTLANADAYTKSEKALAVVSLASTTTTDQLLLAGRAGP